MQPLWKRNCLESNEAKALNGGLSLQISQSLGQQIPLLILELLHGRGYTNAETIKQILFPKLTDIRDPFVMKGMSVAVERLVRAFKEKEKVCIYADFDLDGTSGCALLYRGLQGLGFEELHYYQPKRLSEGYGFHKEAVEDLHGQGVQVIVTVDVGITAFAAVDRARELGVDVILTDHHLPVDQMIPQAYIVVNPNQGDCPSELGYLCGAGVAFYLLRGLKRAFSEDPHLPKNDFDLRSVLEFFTIATLTDMVPLIDDNRILVKLGLKSLENTTKPGLRVLFDELGMSGRPLTSQDVAIRFAPKLNALSRMESEILPVDIMLESDWKKAAEMVAFVMENNSTRVQLQAEAEKEALELLKDWPHEDFVFVASQKFHRGVIGLIATKLSQTFNKVSLVGALGEDGMIVGSARLPGGKEISLIDVLSSGQQYLSRFGGHMAAAGFELASHYSEKFVSDIHQFFQRQKMGEAQPLELEYDLATSLSLINQQILNWHDFMGPYGTGFPIPIFRFDRVFILQCKELRGGHLKLKLKDSFGLTQVDALLFSPTARQRQVAMASMEAVDILGELQWNYFAGRKTMQILVKDVIGSCS